VSKAYVHFSQVIFTHLQNFQFEKTGEVVGALTVQEADEIMLITSGGQMVRTFARDIRQTGRNAQGVKLIDLDANDKLQAIAPVISEEGEVQEIEPEPGPEVAP
jgi:DNA gyrase subunit A